MYKKLERFKDEISDESFFKLFDAGCGHPTEATIQEIEGAIHSAETPNDLAAADSRLNDLLYYAAYLRAAKNFNDRLIFFYEQLIDPFYYNSNTSALVAPFHREIMALQDKNASKDDIIRTNGFEEELNQLENKIHRTIDDYKAAKSSLPENSSLSARKK